MELVARGGEEELVRGDSPEVRSEEEGPGYLEEFPLSPIEEKRLSHVGEAKDNKELIDSP